MDTETYMLKLKFKKDDAVRIMELLHAAREAANEEPRAGWRERYLLEIIDGDLKQESEDESNLSYRKATLLDVAKILALSDIYLDKDVLITRQYLINNIARGNIWVVFDGCKLVAFSISGFKRKSCLWNLYVHPEYRNRGIGRSLIEKINPEIIRVKSDQSTGDPTGYYKKMGYTVIETMQGKKRNITIMKLDKDNERGITMKALAYRNYVPGQEGYWCCACVERDQRRNDYPHLFFTTTKPELIDEKIRCAWCGYSVGGHEASCAAERIAKMITANDLDSEK